MDTGEQGPYTAEPEAHAPLASPGYASTRLRAPQRPPVLLPQRLDRADRPAARRGAGRSRSTPT